MEAPKTGVEVVVVPQPQLELQQPPVKLLTPEERNDLRKFVLSGGQLTLEQARQVYETIRQGQGSAAIVGEATKKTKKKKESYSDDNLNADFEKLGI